jgi:hypothetical protein
LHPFRKTKLTDDISVNDFFESCSKKISQKKRRQISSQDPIYQKKDGLKFEL